MLQEGIRQKIIQKHLGHSRISLTLAVYSHLLSTMQIIAATKLDAFLTSIVVDLQ